MIEDFWGVAYKQVPSRPDKIVKVAGGRQCKISLLVCFRVWRQLNGMSPICAALTRLGVMVNIGRLLQHGTLQLPGDVVPPVSSAPNLSSDLGRETTFLCLTEGFFQDVLHSLSQPQTLFSSSSSDHHTSFLTSLNLEERMLPALLAIARGVWEEQEEEQGKNKRIEAIGRSMREASLKPVWIKVFPPPSATSFCSSSSSNLLLPPAAPAAPPPAASAAPAAPPSLRLIPPPSAPAPPVPLPL
eukprot:752634-Hanusia_phi.AAC.2